MYNSLSNIFRLGIKEFWSLWRDPMMLVLIIYAFTVSVYIQSKGMPETLQKAAIAITDEDQSPVTNRIRDAFVPPYFNRPAYISQSEIDMGMDSGIYTFALDLPPNFQRDLLDGRHPSVQLNIDATRMTQAFTGGGYIQQILNDEVSGFVQRYRKIVPSPADLVTRVRFNPNLTQFWFAAVIQVIDNVTMLSIILTGAALIREREHGTIEHLLVMPITPFEIMTAKIWSMGLIVLIACAFSLVVIVRCFMGVPIEGSIALFLAGTAINLFATTSIGIFLGTFAKSMPQFALLVILIMIPLQMLSGGLTPRENMPQFVQFIMLGAPTTHFVSLAQGILYRGADITVVWPQFIAIAIIGVVFFTIALSMFGKRISSMT
ncbi:ABC-2 transporter permease [Zymomonas mobilis]|uniref:ABC-2 transporter permease n=1 Tax=Zymomonas mobilis TaxID=542 RepID=UPI0011665F0A|nr:ABC transporter permease [Zymomonas mobilis]MDX5949556.1 ABC transporter permease [Zymomonas mobilis subsp. pomaceae]GEB90023.1 membrane protein [Zymomonas mobilis subsp. pomaceae]